MPSGYFGTVVIKSSDEKVLNRITIMGRLGRDPEVRYTQAGRPVASFSLAVDRDFKDKASGERATDWIPVVAWEARAKFVQQYFRKGQLAVVEGRLQIRDWTDRDGGKRRSAEVIADGIYFAGTRSAPPSEGNADEGTLPPPPAGELQDLEDDGELPF